LYPLLSTNLESQCTTFCCKSLSVLSWNCPT